MRLIDADALIQKESVMRKGCAYIEEINNAPTIDAVEVVRCKECDSYVEVAWRFDDEGEKKERYCCVAHSMPVQPNDFCSYGERKEP